MITPPQTYSFILLWKQIFMWVKFLIKLNFYQFQIRESKKQKIIELREKFEADKKKVERMKQDRKFKPMTAWVIPLFD